MKVCINKLVLQPKMVSVTVAEVAWILPLIVIFELFRTSGSRENQFWHVARLEAGMVRFQNVWPNKKILKSINLIKICSNNFIYLSSLLNKTLLLWLIVTILFHIKQIFYLINCTFFMRQKIKYCHSWWVVGFICNNNIFYQVTFD